MKIIHQLGLQFALQVISATLASGAMPAIIPVPVEIKESEGDGFTANRATRLLYRGKVVDAPKVFTALADLLAPATGSPPKAAQGELGATNAVVLNFDSAQWPESLRTMTSTEAYVLTVDAARIVIHARTAHGAFNAVQTLRQMLPPAFERLDRPNGLAWQVPAVFVRDEPGYAWRGMMLDVGRYFYGVDEVKRLIDLLALQKFSVFHWHLTENEGWRIEIKKYPRLTQVGAWRDESPMRSDPKRGDRIRYGGFYTQEQIRDVVAYAADHFITIVPEIDLPGHSEAAIAAYPELGNTDVPGYAPKVATRWAISRYTYAPKEETFRFFEDVMREVMALFPGPFIHIGGDEAPKDQWKTSAFAQDFMRTHGLKTEEELQSYIIGRVGRFLTDHGRKFIGWDEIQEGGTPPGATVMLWRAGLRWIPGKPRPPADWQYLLPPIKAGHDIILSPRTHFYFNFYAVDPATSAEPLAWDGLSTLEMAYTFDPDVPGLTAAERKRIIGLHGALWTNFLWDFPKLEYHMFPRACALAEVAWSPRERRDFADFNRRLAVFQQRLDELGVSYRKAGTVPRVTIP